VLEAQEVAKITYDSRFGFQARGEARAAVHLGAKTATDKEGNF